MKLTELLHGMDVVTLSGCQEGIEIVGGIQDDSRKVTQGSLFVAVRGTATDGHKYIATAIEQGAVAVVCEAVPEDLYGDSSVVYLKTADSAEALGCLASRWYGSPSERLTVVGVTGTNGKTTIATLLYEMFRMMGHKAGLISTVCNYIDGEAFPTEHTTPGALELQQLIARMASAGCSHVFMEVSSHAVAQRRIAGILFDGAIFTNLTRDHLDYHLTVDNYLRAKKAFFDALPAAAFALTNVDDRNGEVMLQNTAARPLSYSLRTLADFKGKIMETHLNGMQLLINGSEVHVRFTGRFNAANLLAVFGAAVALGKSPYEVLLVLSALVPVAGRFETIPLPSGCTAIVDYAHTPDALVNVLTAIREVLGQKGRIITVVGAGGNRDTGKRPIMAREAARLSEQLVLTSDNPRYEDPDEIIRQMYAGLAPAEQRRTICIADRFEAIKVAVTMATADDVVLVAGKGHEPYQEVKGVKRYFDDREVLRKML
ncbi:MAG: UDP-N-acetylmuramoyl-L-alanyl-D-glutamate--2,6-diaminopimelate ligase [Tannerellaceae bacterium]|jgi:UDP-N-acetylmuramoyl-L-alanyl-D-glutamate--2,6-diaminopimelate ligase|nr:UDP-N-acetylmuramoyl-L-alanyl-D-glutamate--2,6-diaminopimelate ligase [Tannerellaceae bacterium]